jgi:hypothetical protein
MDGNFHYTQSECETEPAQAKNFTVFISLLAHFPIAFGAFFTVAVPSAPVFWNTLNTPRAGPDAK